MINHTLETDGRDSKTSMVVVVSTGLESRKPEFNLLKITKRGCGRSSSPARYVSKPPCLRRACW